MILNKYYTLLIMIVFTSISFMYNISTGANHASIDPGKVRSSVSDAYITTTIKNKYLSDQDLRNYDIEVKTVAGVVTLFGEVPNFYARDNALLIARETEGVIDVISKLNVKENK